MEIYPAVDILDGRCVQLVQGRPEAATVYGDPAAWAHRWLDQGADGLHVVNLDGAFGRARKNADLIRAFTRDTETFVELGGGIRSVEDAAGWLDAGVDRVIVSTQAVREPEIVRTLSDEFGGERVMAGIDARAGEVMIEGWERPAGSYLSWAERFESLGAGSLLYTNVDVEGLQQGVAIEPVAELLRRVKVPVVVSGGISSPGDVAALRKAGAVGAVLGSALYAGKVRLSEAMEVAHANE
ncbi:1-(5-phosphoribosyl)-5-[(5-phosphoribosylamino)methylideneamino]imidazole-4-carboxamide isomerase [Methanoculleus sp. FWC-SCC3]|uniref:1-(5-phosphoribosyl)-5-[(5-phosphoribosylamino)methylideneamino] imidazole-4-carboxamide isomerase n=1 Tax=Methanoculleus methanifontis TaxID=2584086 RepID=A0ABT8LZJ1_9EURY|nr:1-(5-phosphoribosyl)-5-[(5-phosphoribosylamino)methylideneamino]imidazole-4-carboxamide isomerase [Methanoculleus sp. FWC-SCC3]MDN7012204.1 1-(5-phosphoribosyl)-5-[(5-phosphoribosylamino)methylideneamino]imidazole-4-carboxamide isomerase [Methanoculleus sp. FWC-SCC3]